MTRAAPGSHARYIENVAAPCTDAECLIWPFPCGDMPYPAARYKGKSNSVHVHVCTIVHGPRPSPEYTVAHSCGRGTDRCVNGSHLSWKTQTENIADKKSHGTEPVGEDRWSAKLTEAEALEIITRARLGDRHKAIAADYGIHPRYVSAIVTGRKWKHLNRSVQK